MIKKVGDDAADYIKSRVLAKTSFELKLLPHVGALPRLTFLAVFTTLYLLCNLRMSPISQIVALHKAWQCFLRTQHIGDICKLQRNVRVVNMDLGTVIHNTSFVTYELAQYASVTLQ